MAADEEGSGSLQVESGTLQFLRNDHVLHFDRSFKALDVPKTALISDPATLAAKRRAWIDEWLAAMAE